MTRRCVRWKLLPMACAILAAIASTATLAEQSKPKRVDIGYLEIANDARYAEQRRYTGLRLRTRKRPFDGARVAMRESRFVGRAMNIAFRMEKAEAEGPEALVAKVRHFVSTGVHFILVDADGPTLKSLAAATRGSDALIFNVTSPDDSLRGEACAPNLMHTYPSRAMLTDALAQYLVSKGWRDILALKGPSPEDAALTASFQKSAKKFGATVVATKAFVLGHDPRQREQNNVALLTSTPRHDVVFVADAEGEFGRYVPYQTSRARPVVGTEGLIPAAWHWTWERHGAPQLNQRFDKMAKRTMRGPDWAAWAAVKSIVEAVVRTRSTDFAKIAAYLKSDALTLDGYKGVPSSYRSWNNQLRQPLLLHTYNAVVARAPIAGFAHRTNDLDTLGVDRPESRCKF